ncbi:MAG: hypothetical protein QW734_02140 [Candidatus Bathyarchaeia archaeon]
MPRTVKVITMNELPCETLLEIAEDEWKAYKEYLKMPEPFKTFAMDELKHFSHAAIIIREKCPQLSSKIDELIRG